MSHVVSLVVASTSSIDAPSVKTVDLPRPPVPVELVRSAPGRRLWVVGLPVSIDGSVERLLDAAVVQDLASARRALTSLDGAFAAFLWDASERRLIVVNDIAGLQPLYMRRVRSGVMFAPRIDELAGDASPDPAGWGGFVGFGNFIGPHTSVDGVTRVLPATVVEYDAGSDRLSSATYWPWPEMAPQATLDRVDTGELLAIVDANLRACDAYHRRPTLLLSGGFESRLLAALLTKAGRPPSALTLRNPYEHFEIDGRFAARVARTLGLRHELRDPDSQFFSSAKYLDYVRLHEVASTSVNLFIAQVASELQAANVEASWDGFPFGSIVKEKSAESFDAFLAKIQKPFDGPAWHAARQVFTPGFADAMRDGLERAVHREIDACHPAPHGTQQFFQRNRIRHRIAPNTLKVYASFLLPLLPGLARAFYERVVPIPPSARKGEALYFRIFERHFPELARIPWCSGGHLMPGTRKGLGYRAIAARSAAVEHPRTGDILRRLGVTASRGEVRYVSDAVRSAPLDDPYLNADGIRTLQQTAPSGTNADTFARELVFYWTMWRDVMKPARVGPYALAL
jgi:hypothetical protein